MRQCQLSAWRRQDLSGEEYIFLYRCCGGEECLITSPGRGFNKSFVYTADPKLDRSGSSEK
uniref:Uncharacterized protein n=1 Tax=Anguilla anguilla TaxID=7936 RepID=A0A0E9SUP3_ANGAN